MAILGTILSLPVSGPLNGLLWIAEQISAQAEDELYSPQRIRQQLTDLELRLDLGQISEETYLEAEELLLVRLREARERQRNAQ